MTGKRRNYFSYLLRIWLAPEGERITWRASLERPGTGEQQAFASLEALFAFIQQETHSRGEERRKSEEDTLDR